MTRKRPISILEAITAKLDMNLYSGQNKKDIEYLLFHIACLKKAGNEMAKDLELVDDGGGWDSTAAWTEVNEDGTKL